MASENSSEEDHTKLCDSCSFRGLQKLAFSRCTECEEYLCNACDEIHRSFKATRGHVLESLDATQGATGEPLPAFMLCDEHQSEPLTLFCVDHQQVSCQLCKITRHRKCTTKTVIEAADESKSRDEVGFLAERFKKLISEFEEIVEIRKSHKTDVENCSLSIREEVERVKVEVLAWFDALEKKLEEDLVTKESGQMQEIENHISTSKQIMKQLKGVTSSFETLGEQDQAKKFTLMMKSKEQLVDGERVKEEIVQEIKPVTFSLATSDQIKNIKYNIPALGKIVDDHHGLLCVDINFLDITSVTKRDPIPDITHSVTGCTFMRDGKLVICHGWPGDKMIKVLTKNFKLKDEFKEDSGVWDVAAIGPDDIIVTGRESKQLCFFDISAGIVKKKSIKVGIVCYGIDCKNDKLFISGCEGERKEVHVLTMNCETIQNINIKHQGQPYYIAINTACNRVITSTDTGASVLGTDIVGNSLFKYTDSKLNDPLGLLFDKGDNFLVCGCDSHNVHIVSKNGTRDRVVLSEKDGIEYPYCLAYRPSDKTLLVGQRGGQPLLVFTIN